MCNQCEILFINGVKCHETGCPDSWKDEQRSCKWCGQEFKPVNQYQECCDNSCESAYCGYPDPDEIAEYNDYHSTC